MANTANKKKVKKDQKKRNRAPGAKPVDTIHYHGSTALYGRSGTGKTTLSGTWPKPILYLNIRDNGTDSIRDLGDDVDVKHIESSEDLEEVVLWCLAEAKEKKLDYKSIVLDTMTQLQQIRIEEVLAEKQRKGKKLPKDKRPGDWGTMSQQEFGSVAGYMKGVVQDIRGLPLHSVFIAQERIFNANDEEEGGDRLSPSVGARLMPSVRDDLNASVSIIGNTYIRVKEIKTEKKKKGKGEVVKIKKQFCLRLGPNEVYDTKIRKPKGIEAPDHLVDPTFAKIMAIIEGKE